MAAIDWKHVYSPRFVRGATTVLAPQPIRQSGESMTKRVSQITIPQRDGVVVPSVNRGAMTVTFSGVIRGLSKEHVLSQKHELQEFLIESNQSFTFYRYFDADYLNYRWYEDCHCLDLGFDLDPRSPASGILPYRFSLLVPGGREKELTASGQTPDSVQPGGPGEASSSADTLPGTTEYLYGPIIVKLNTGGQFLIKNSSGEYTTRILDDGSVQTTGFVEHVDEISL